MAPGAGPRMDGLVVPALVVDMVEAEQLDPAGIEVVGEHLVHAPVAPLVTAPQGGGEDQHPRAGVPEDLDGHLAAEGRTDPGVMCVVQWGSLVPLYPSACSHQPSVRP